MHPRLKFVRAKEEGLVARHSLGELDPRKIPCTDWHESLHESRSGSPF